MEWLLEHILRLIFSTSTHCPMILPIEQPFFNNKHERSSIDFAETSHAKHSCFRGPSGLGVLKLKLHQFHNLSTTDACCQGQQTDLQLDSNNDNSTLTLILSTFPLILIPMNIWNSNPLAQWQRGPSTRMSNVCAQIKDE